MTSLLIFLAITLSYALDLGGTNYPDTAVLHANFTDGTLAMIKSSDDQLYLCENDECSCKQPITLYGTEAYTEQDNYIISSLKICDMDCVPCSFTGFDWECMCPDYSVMSRNINCVS